MNSPSKDEWSDLAAMWQADAAGVSLQEIDQHLRREQRQMRGVLLAELAGLGAGLVAAALVLFFTPQVVLGAVIIVFGGMSAWLSLRMRRAVLPAGSANLLQSLKESIDREDWLSGQLRLGRAVSLVALFAIVIATAMQLLRLKAFSPTGMLAAAIGCAVVLTALAWNLVLTVRSRRRQARLRYLQERMRT